MKYITIPVRFLVEDDTDIMELVDSITVDHPNIDTIDFMNAEEEAAEQDDDEGATYEWFMSLDKTAQTEWLIKVRSHGNPFFQTDQDIIDSLPKEAAE